MNLTTPLKIEFASGRKSIFKKGVEVRRGY
jgi:hypothetical protein